MNRIVKTTLFLVLQAALLFHGQLGFARGELMVNLGGPISPWTIPSPQEIAQDLGGRKFSHYLEAGLGILTPNALQRFQEDQQRLLNAYQLLGIRYDIYQDPEFFLWQTARLRNLGAAELAEQAEFPLQVIIARDYLEYKSQQARNAAAFAASVNALAQDPALANHAPAAMSGYKVAAIWVSAWAFGVVNGAIINGFFANALTNFAAPFFDPTFQFLKRRGLQLFGDRAAAYATWLNRDKNAQLVLENGPKIQEELAILGRKTEGNLGRVGVTPNDFMQIRKVLREGWIPMITVKGKAVTALEAEGRGVMAEAAYLRRGWLDQLITNFQNKEVINQIAIRQIMQGWQTNFPADRLVIDTIVGEIMRLQVQSVLAIREGQPDAQALFQQRLDEQMNRLIVIARSHASAGDAAAVEAMIKRQAEELMANNLLRLEGGRQVIGAMVAKYMDMILYTEYDVGLVPQVENWVRTMQQLLGPEFVASSYNAEVNRVLKEMGLQVEGVVQDANFVVQSSAHRRVRDRTRPRQQPAPAPACAAGYSSVAPAQANR
jgi:hypothetical protein